MITNQKDPRVVVMAVSSKKQLLRLSDVCAFLNVSVQTLHRIRTDGAQRFPPPLQILGTTPIWSVDQIEKWVTRNEKAVETLSA